eukprot:6210249-Pleurochrysis_carterae.AAC.2
MAASCARWLLMCACALHSATTAALSASWSVRTIETGVQTSRTAAATPTSLRRLLLPIDAERHVCRSNIRMDEGYDETFSQRTFAPTVQLVCTCSGVAFTKLPCSYDEELKGKVTQSFGCLDTDRQFAQIILHAQDAFVSRRHAVIDSSLHIQDRTLVEVELEVYTRQRIPFAARCSQLNSKMDTSAMPPPGDEYVDERLPPGLSPCIIKVVASGIIGHPKLLAALATRYLRVVSRMLSSLLLFKLNELGRSRVLYGLICTPLIVLCTLRVMVISVQDAFRSTEY